MSTPIEPVVQRATGRLNAARRNDPRADHTGLFRDVSASRIYHYATKVMDTAPALTGDQVAAIVAVLERRDPSTVLEHQDATTEVTA
ncbi:hypothetical protein ACT3UN_03520 [Corynebacterium sp. AOP12-C2-36]